MSKLNMKNTKAVVLLSGGLDSATVLAYACNQGYNVYAISFDYGQKALIELEAAKKLVNQFGAKHKIIKIDLGQIGGSSLTSEIEVAKLENGAEPEAGIPLSYVPARNTILLSIACGFAETIEAYDVFYGANYIDNTGYTDCRPEFIRSFTQTINLGTKAAEQEQKFEIHAPLINLTKAGIIELGTKLGVDYGDTMSCYDPLPNFTHCGTCNSCYYRKQGFADAGITDPSKYMSA